MVTLLGMMMLAALLLAACSNGGSAGGDAGGGAEPVGAGSGGANGSDAANGEGSDAGPAEKITISIYYPTPDREDDRKLEDDKIRRFTEQYPNVEVVKSDWQYSPNEIGIKMAANEAPTLFNTYATEGKFLAERGWAADITALFDDYAYKEQMNPILQEQFILDGKVYGIAQRGYVTGTVVNTKMLRERGAEVPPLDWTWDDLLTTAPAVADPGAGISGIAPMGKANDAGWNWTNFLFEAGGEIQAIEGGKVVAKFNSEAGAKALDFYKRLRWEANAIPQDWALDWGDAVGSFAQGRTAMVIAGPDGPVDQGLNQGGMSPDDIAVYPMPAMEAGGAHTGVLGGDYLVVNPNASPEEQEMAFRYATFDYFSDNFLTSLEANIQARKDDGKYFIPPVIEYFDMESAFGQKVKAVYDKFDNVYQYDPASIALMDGKPEAQFNTQDYYATMTNVIQEVFANENVDVQAQLDAAAQLVQTEFLDPIEVK
ncbi:extracellular solute-binding protein [Paenibacillus sp. IB182496]|uniref:Extracellular solute-binding protein n=2 Tax=Paenibacillus sabuli TaxID=2772509 RepID=A0A927GUW7_9BACL|nr:extracellular solute-binding protein [Paenibacillus sabuli]